MFLIGEFSKISQVSKRLLHYYDDIGLLKPAHIEQASGYRYYSAKQLPRLNRILALKGLGLTLEQIKKMLHVVPAKVEPGTLGHFAGVFYTDGFTQSHNDADLGYFLKKPVKKPVPLTEDCVLRMHELPVVEAMATSVQVAGPDPALIGLGQIAQWIEGNGYRIAGPYREIGYDISSLSDLEEAVIEIQMPVEKANPSSNLNLNFSD
ncbi:Transcriptional regulator, MerR family [hydrothermal vent metagenome]|uniref:Transcriptional regulator, MerR family n=1 Tax=hydrothermal vent metagenome TaxID=652676 RepID=A0A3B0VTB8_9ZZZZ